MALYDAGSDNDRAMAVFAGGVMFSRDRGVSWRGGVMEDPWRLSVEGYQPVLLDVRYQVPAHQRLVAAADSETFVLVLG